jgi:maltose alpha-D-glucosyltransferase/alpha-amylase
MKQRKEPAWLKTAVFYEIYPQSFYDTNADGIGDLEGIIRKLGYIRDLGCNAIWINPCFASPFQDAGYDVEDYYRIAPRYGTNADMKRLCSEARKKGIRILLDLVPGHTSIRNKWFQESCKPERNRYSDWFVWTDSAWNASYKDLKLINGFADRDGCYVTNFFYSQPALNFGFAKPDPKARWQQAPGDPGPMAVKAEIRKIIRFWLDMGVSGFRVDMAGSLVKFDKDGRKTSEFWNDIRKMLDRDYPEAVLVSEWSDPAAAVRDGGFHVDFMLPFGKFGPAYKSLFRHNEERKPSFFDRKGEGDIRIFLDPYLKHLSNIKGRGYLGLISGNHDCVRIRKERKIEDLKPAFTMILTLPSIPFIYYGDEIGMNYLPLSSKEGGFGRTGSRTPMQWSDSRNAGFSSATAKKLYLPVDTSKDRPSVARQAGRNNSLLETVRALIRIRKTHPALGTAGDFKTVFAQKGRYPFVYLRTLGKERFLIAVNPSGKRISLKPDLIWSRSEPVFTSGVSLKGKTLVCGPASSGIFRLE